MNTDKVWFEGSITNLIELNDDLETFPEETISHKSLHGRLLYMQGCKMGGAFFYPLVKEEKKDFMVKNWEGHFKNFQTDINHKTTKFEYNGKIYHIYADKSTSQERWQPDFESVFDSKEYKE